MHFLPWSKPKAILPTAALLLAILLLPLGSKLLALSPYDLVGCWIGQMVPGDNTYINFRQDGDGWLRCTVNSKDCDGVVEFVDQNKIRMSWDGASYFGRLEQEEELIIWATQDDPNGGTTFGKATACPPPVRFHDSHRTKNKLTKKV